MANVLRIKPAGPRTRSRPRFGWRACLRASALTGGLASLAGCGYLAACTAQRGRWATFGDPASGPHYCIVPTTDGGKAYTDTADCQGYCVVPPGPLAPVAPGTKAPGVCAASYQQDCFQYVIRSTAQPRVCLTSTAPPVVFHPRS